MRKDTAMLMNALFQLFFATAAIKLNTEQIRYMNANVHAN